MGAVKSLMSTLVQRRGSRPKLKSISVLRAIFWDR